MVGNRKEAVDLKYAGAEFSCLSRKKPRFRVASKSDIVKPLLEGHRSDLCTGQPSNHCGQYSAAASCSEELFS